MAQTFKQDFFEPEPSASDAEAWAWAQRLIREVSEEVASQDRQARDFLRTWVRWNDLVRFLNFSELCVIKRGGISAEERQWHETLSAGLISLGGLLRDWATKFDANTLDLADYSSEVLETMMTSLREGNELWHTPRSQARIKAISDLLPAP